MFSLQATLLKALAHPRRLEIVHLLRDQELYVSEIYAMLDLPQANISQHLMILREASVVSTKKEGKHIRYAISHPAIITASDALREMLIEQNQHTPIADHLTMSMRELLPLTHDPVCKMRISPKTAGYATQHGRQRYYFCASGCMKKFIERPELYVKP